ncbi:uncharacterized [Tachysurus ichikawai]
MYACFYAFLCRSANKAAWQNQQIVVDNVRRICLKSADLSERKPLRNGRSASASYRRHHKGIRGGWALRSFNAFKNALLPSRGQADQ